MPPRSIKVNETDPFRINGSLIHQLAIMTYIIQKLIVDKGCSK